MSCHDLAAAIRNRRRELGYSQEDLYATGGPSVPTIRRIENHDHDDLGCMTRQRPSTYRKLDDGLRWTAGTAVLILNAKEGGAPTPVSAPRPPSNRDQRALAVGRLVIELFEELIGD